MRGVAVLRNAEVRKALKDNKVCMYELAEYYGVSCNTITNRLRQEFSDAKKAEVLDVIERIAQSHTAIGKDW